MPIVDALTIDESAAGASTILVQDIHVGVVTVALDEPIDVTFKGCRIDSGIVDQSSQSGHTETLLRCDVRGNTQLRGRGIAVDSCTIAGVLDLRSEGCEVRGNVFLGGSGTGLYIQTQIGVVQGNVFSDYERGIEGHGDPSLVITDNVFERCASSAIRATGGTLSVTNNRIGSSGVGIEGHADTRIDLSLNVVRGGVGGMVVTGKNATARDNTIFGASVFGLVVSGQDVIVERNIVGRCGGNGIEVGSEDVGTVAHNTAVLNTASGLILATHEGGGELHHNIAYANNVGLVWNGEGIVEPYCNDVFGNSDNSRGSADVSMDPQFCGLGADDVHLRVDSPVLDALGCGLIGALGEGCDVQTPTLVAVFSASRLPQGIEVRWRVAQDAQAAEVWIERAASAAGPWSAVTTHRTFEGDVVCELDRSATFEEAYWYRLVSREGSETHSLGTPIKVEAESRERFGLAVVAPNPTRGPLEVEFDLARKAEINLDLFDVQGRNVSSLAHGSWPAGRHRIEWSGMSSGGGLAPGVYLLRYRHPEGQEYRRIVRTR